MKSKANISRPHSIIHPYRLISLITLQIIGREPSTLTADAQILIDKWILFSISNRLLPLHTGYILKVSFAPMHIDQQVVRDGDFDVGIIQKEEVEVICFREYVVVELYVLRVFDLNTLAPAMMDGRAGNGGRPDVLVDSLEVHSWIVWPSLASIHQFYSRQVDSSELGFVTFRVAIGEKSPPIAFSTCFYFYLSIEMPHSSPQINLPPTIVNGLRTSSVVREGQWWLNQDGCSNNISNGDIFCLIVVGEGRTNH